MQTEPLAPQEAVESVSVPTDQDYMAVEKQPAASVVEESFECEDIGESEAAPMQTEELPSPYVVPWPLRWELKRLHQQSRWQPSREALARVLDTWDQDASVAHGSEESLRLHRARIAAVHREIEQRMVLPWAGAGYVLKYRARVTTSGNIELLEARKDTRSLAYAVFGDQAWLHVEFESIQEGGEKRARERRAQQRVLKSGIDVCGTHFVYFGCKEGRWNSAL